MQTTIRRMWARLRRDRLDDELVEEIRAHLERRTRQLVASGMDPNRAAAEARRLFGNVLLTRETSRDQWSFPTLDTVMQDIRFGVRLLRRSPVFTIVAVLSLAIGIGAASAVLSLVDVVLFKRLPVRAPDELFIVRWISGPVLPFESLSGNSQQGETENSSTSFSLAAFEAVRDRSAHLAVVIGFAELYRVNLGIDQQAELGNGHAVSGNYFDVLGVPPAAGRPLGLQDDQRSAAPVAMISHAVWQRRFGGAPEAVGRAISINGVPTTIVGVTPQGFNGTMQVGDSPAVFVPLSLAARLERTDAHFDSNFWWVLMMARIRPAVSTSDATATFDAIVKQTIVEHRPTLAPRDLPRVALLPGARGQLESREASRQPLQIMGWVAAIVLLVACANLANLLLARASSRNREVAMRVALGAPRSRVVRQLLTESLLLAALGGTAGLLLAQWVATSLATALDPAPFSVLSVPLDWRTVAFTLGIAAMASLVFGLLPAVKGTRLDIARGIREDSRGQIGGSRRFGLAGALVSLQVALSLILISGAALLVGSMRNLERVDPGFDPSNVLVFRMDPTLNGYQDGRLRALYGTLLERVRALPGVRAASVSSHTLVSGSAAISEVFSDGSTVVPGDAGAASGEASAPTRRRPLAWRLAIDDQFFRTMGMRVLQGRIFGPGESPTSQPVAIVNSAFVRAVLTSGEAIGRRFKLSGRPGEPEYEIVGVVADARYSSIRADVPASVYLSYRQELPGAMTFEVKSDADPLQLIPSIRASIAAVDPDIPLFDVRSQTAQIAKSLQRERLFARLATVLGAVTLLLAAIGLYGLLSGSVTRRTPEIGIRLALGAGRREVLWMVLRQSLRLAVIGVAFGVPAALWGTRVLESLLFGLSATNVWVLAAAAVMLLAVSAVAAYLPARRAARVDPVTALRT